MRVDSLFEWRERVNMLISTKTDGKYRRRRVRGRKIYELRSNIDS